MSIQFVMTILHFAISLGPTLIFGFTGTACTEAFENYSRYMYKSNWYNLPNDLQKYTILVIANGNRPLFFHGMNILTLDLHTIASVRIMLFKFRFIAEFDLFLK